MRYLIGFALLLPTVVFAKDPPLPEALLNAKTAFVEKVGTAEESFDKDCKELKLNAGATDKKHDKYCKELKNIVKADQQLFEKTCKELKKWGRFTLVQDRNSADIRILLASTWSKSRSIGTISNNTSPLVGADSPPVYIGERTYQTDNGKTYTMDGKTYGIVKGQAYSLDTSPVYTAPRQSITAFSLSLPGTIEAIINIRDRRNDSLLYLEQAAGPGILISHLKHKMKQK